MPRAPSPSAGPLPRWLVVAGSAVILYHLAAIIIPVLDVRSGPWPTPMGPDMALPPEFAHSAADLSTPQGKYLRVAHSYHFISDRPADVPVSQFEVRLRDAQGKLMGEPLRIPDPQANLWVRHRQEVLASALGVDFPAQQQGGEALPPAGQQVPTLDIWLPPEARIPGEPGGASPESAGDRKVQLRLRKVPLHLIPRDPGVRRPSEWSLIVARSYARHLCRAHGAATAEIVRLSRDPVPPAVLFKEATPDDAFAERAASFGEMSR